MNSMTQEELKNPSLIKSNRINRIAKGSGTEPSEMRELLKQYNQIKKIMKGLKGKDIQKLTKRLGKKMPKFKF